MCQNTLSAKPSLLDINKAISTGKKAIRLGAALLFAVYAATSFAQSYQPPTMNFTEFNETMGGSPALGVLGNTLYIAYRANDSSNSLWIDSSTDGATTPGPVNFPGITLGSDPSIAGDNQDNLIEVAFKSASNDTMWICAITPPLSPRVCYAF